MYVFKWVFWSFRRFILPLQVWQQVHYKVIWLGGRVVLEEEGIRESDFWCDDCCEAF